MSQTSHQWAYRNLSTCASDCGVTVGADILLATCNYYFPVTKHKLLMCAQQNMRATVVLATTSSSKLGLGILWIFAEV